jgi:hypothetical protein
MKGRTNHVLYLLLLTVLAALTGCKSPPPLVLIPPLPFRAASTAPAITTPSLTMMASSNNLQVLTFPDGLLIKSGAGQAFASLASGYDKSTPPSYQWEWSKNPVAAPGPAEATWKDLVILDTNFVAIANATNKVYTIVSASANDVAYYRVRVTVGTNSVISKPSPVWVWTKDDIGVQGTIVTQNGTTPTPCSSQSYASRADMPYVPAGAGPYSACGNFSNCVIRWYEYWLTFQPGCGQESSSCVPTPLARIFPGYYYGWTAYSPTTISGTFTLTLGGF